MVDVGVSAVPWHGEVRRVRAGHFGPTPSEWRARSPSTRRSRETSKAARYFISSLPGDDAQKFALAVRRHWTGKNNLSWVLDVAFGADNRRVHKDNAPENMAMLRYLAFNLRKAGTTTKVGLQTRRKKAGWDDWTWPPASALQAETCGSSRMKMRLPLLRDSACVGPTW